MAQAKDIMNANVIVTDPDDLVDEVMAQMLESRISGLPVVDLSGQLVGVITEYDLLDLVWDPDTGKNKVYHYMTRDVRTVDENEDFTAVAEMFRIFSIRRLLVMQGEQIVGVISRCDLIQHVLKLRQQSGEKTSDSLLVQQSYHSLP